MEKIRGKESEFFMNLKKVRFLGEMDIRKLKEIWLDLGKIEDGLMLGGWVERDWFGFVGRF